MKRRHPFWILSGFGLLIGLIGALILFPGQRLWMAWVIAGGIQNDRLQSNIDRLEEKAILNQEFSVKEREFLYDFYKTLATGARLTVILGQTGGLMEHYLSGSGKLYELNPSIFIENENVKVRMSVLRNTALASGCREQTWRTKKFYMPHASNPDSVFGLYFGYLELRSIPNTYGTCDLTWRAEVPWHWPTYESLKRKYGSYHAESFPIPNLNSMLFGGRPLYVDNGLGAHLVKLKLAAPFLAYAQWTEVQ